MREKTEVCGERKSTKVAQRATSNQTVFTVPKGVATFDFCTNQNLLVTGGMDKLLRMWMPYVPRKPTGILKGHTAPVSYLCIASEDGHIFSVSTDNTAKDQTCLFTAHPKASQIQGELSACLYSSAVKGLYIASDSLALLSLQIKYPKGSQIVSHKEPVLCCGYSEEFRQVVSCSEGSDVETGAQVFEYGCAYGESAITCMAFDTKTWLKIVLKILSHIPYKAVVKQSCIFPRCAEICGCAYLTLHRNVLVISVGWGPCFSHDLILYQNGHKEDILCIAHCTPHLVATGSYDGELIVWNVVSGRIQCRFQTPQSQQSSSTHYNWHFLLTSPMDCSVRLWSIHGEFIGTFGQEESWSINTPSSWKQPAVPYEILIDPIRHPDIRYCQRYCLSGKKKKCL
uniref:WD40 repeat domain 95 n=1 Tax=Sinocyclocheilus grahami TaxID=75366 RepID=A0A672Q753_SINGR